MQTIFVNGGDDHIGPESTPILAVPPTFVFYSAFSQANLELLCGLFVFEIIFAIKFGKMLANNVLFSVPLQELGTLVPGSDITLRVEKEYGIIFDRLNKNPKCFIC